MKIKEIQKVIEGIQANDPKLKKISITNEGLTDNDVALLIKKIIDYPPIGEVTELEFDGNLLTKIPDLTEFKKLKTLSLGGNNIKSITNLSWPKKLEGLYLNGNAIQYVDDLEWTISLKELYLHNNPLTFKSKLLLIQMKLRFDNKVIISFDIIPLQTIITKEIVMAFYKPIVAILASNILEYYKNVSLCLLPYLPLDMVREISTFLPIMPENTKLELTALLRNYSPQDIEELLLKFKNYSMKALGSETIQKLAVLIEFLKNNHFDHANLNKKNGKGFTPLMLAKKMATDPIHPSLNAKAIIPLIKNRILYRGLISHYASEYKNLVTTYARSQIVPSSRRLKM